MFGFHKKDTEINPYGVSDKITFRNVDQTITLFVRANVSTMLIKLRQAQERLSAMKDENTETEREEAARMFAKSIFDDEQAEELMTFYNNDPLAVITACGTYFNTRLSGIIAKAQKK